MLEAPQVLPLSPRVSTPFTPRVAALPCTISDITTTMSDASITVKLASELNGSTTASSGANMTVLTTQDQLGSSNGDTSPITPVGSDMHGYNRWLKEDNTTLANK